MLTARAGYLDAAYHWQLRSTRDTTACHDALVDERSHHMGVLPFISSYRSLNTVSASQKVHAE
jgi:hypothetical protein